MIAQLTGQIASKQPNTLILDVGGVGYEVTIPLSTFYVIGDVGAAVTLRIQTNVREDAIQLFGFATASEKELFLKLTSVTGIGPKLAITVLSGLSAADLVRGIQANDLARLTAVPGIGRKTAERLVIELRDKVGAIVVEEAGIATAAPTRTAEPMLRDDTIAALIALGYPKPIAERAVDAALREEGEHTIQSLLKKSLARLSR